MGRNNHLKNTMGHMSPRPGPHTGLWPKFIVSSGPEMKLSDLKSSRFTKLSDANANNAGSRIQPDWEHWTSTAKNALRRHSLQILTNHMTKPTIRRRVQQMKWKKLRRALIQE